ncbi:MAG TPA: antitoxin VapB family protein [Candidatus Norongarragalinales archaeon]|jgi:predicted CopG family antitoxin|nr:antitoxin VapB family protein [Candidatus Norongarragalinales archaeon]
MSSFVMPFKTLTVTKRAYVAARAAKKPGESFSEMFLRVFGKPSIWELAGIMSGPAGEKFERTIMQSRKQSAAAYEAKIKRISRELGAH